MEWHQNDDYYSHYAIHTCVPSIHVYVSRCKTLILNGNDCAIEGLSKQAWALYFLCCHLVVSFTDDADETARAQHVLNRFP